MILRDLVSIPLGNLRRSKLRSALTVSGVMIAIGAFVAMLSFGAGNQQYVTDQWNELGLFTTMLVYPPHDDEPDDTVSSAVLNDSTVAWLAALPGVELAYPFASYRVTAVVGDTTVKSNAQAVPESAARTKLFSRLEAGRLFASDSAGEVVASSRFLEQAGIESPDSLLGKQLVISVERVRLDSGLVHLIKGAGESTGRIFRQGWLDSLKESGYLQRLVRTELNQAVSRFTDGFFNRPAMVSDTLTVTGVLKSDRGRTRLEPLLIPVATADRFAAGGLSKDPAELYAVLTGGTSIGFAHLLCYRDNFGDDGFRHLRRDPTLARVVFGEGPPSGGPATGAS